MRSIYTIIQYVCVNDYDYSFWGFVIGIITLIGGSILASSLYLKTEKNAKKRDDDIKKKITSKINSTGIIYPDDEIDR